MSNNTIDSWNQAVTNRKVAMLFDSTRDMGRSDTRTAMQLSAESATALYKAAAPSAEAAAMLTRTLESATRVVDSAVAGWNTSVNDLHSFEALMNISAESSARMPTEAREYLHRRAKITADQKAHAAQALVMASNPIPYIMATESAQALRSRHAGQAGVQIQHGYHDRTLANLLNGRLRSQDPNMVLSAENFSDSPTMSLLARYAVVYHTAAQRQEAAVEAAYPTLLLPIDQLGVHMTVRLVTAIANARHSIDGSRFNLNRENVLNAMVYPENFQASQTKAIPMYLPGNAANAARFVDPTLFTPIEVNYDRMPYSGLTPAEIASNLYKSNLLKFGEEHNIIGLSQPQQAVNGGQRNFTDSLNPSANLLNIGITFWDPTAPTDKTKAESYIFNVSEISSAFATEAFDGDTRMVQFNFNSKNLLLTPKNIFEYDKDGNRIQASANKAATPRLNALIASGTTAATPNLDDDLRIEFGFTANGTLNLTTGAVTMSATKIVVKGVTGNNPLKPHRFSETDPEYVDCVTYMSAATAMGYSLDLTFENLNAREYGTRIDSVDMRHFVEVNTHPPITAVGPVMGQQEGIQPDRIQNLQFHAYALQSGRGIEHIFNHLKQADLKYRGEVRLEMTPSTTLGVASYNVNTFYRQFSADAEAMTSGTTNSDVVPNFRDFLANLVLRWAAEADTESRLQIWRETCYGGQAPAPTVLFIIDPILNPYMFTPGDTRLLGDRYPFLVHQTYNAKFRGKIVMLWVDPTNNSTGGPNMMNHGNTLSKAEVILKLPTWREGGTQLELGLAQCYRHVAHLPLGAELTVTGIDALLTTKVSRAVNIEGMVETHPNP